jgi:hypothetical protein
VNRKKWNPTIYKCPTCWDYIYSYQPGAFVTCFCGDLSVDQTGHYTRLLGNNLSEVEAVGTLEEGEDV